MVCVDCEGLTAQDLKQKRVSTGLCNVTHERLLHYEFLRGMLCNCLTDSTGVGKEPRISYLRNVVLSVFDNEQPLMALTFKAAGFCWHPYYPILNNGVEPMK